VFRVATGEEGMIKNTATLYRTPTGGGEEQEIDEDDTDVLRAYKVTVIDSSASVNGSGYYLPTEDVTISAGIRTVFAFNGWTINSGGITLDDLSSPTNTFNMPSNDVTVTANWKELVGPGALSKKSVDHTDSGSGIDVVPGTYVDGTEV